MDPGSADSSASPLTKTPEVKPSPPTEPGTDNFVSDAPSKLSAAGISTWAKNLKIPQPFSGTQEESPTGNSGKSTFARFTSGLGLRSSPKSAQSDDSSEGTSTATQPGFIGSIKKGLVDSSKSAVKAVQVKARHVVSQNKRRYQEGGFDLDMTYITENIIAMGFPAGDMSSGFFGYVEGFYRNHMEEVIKFFETYHKDKYKVYNLCSERLYDASLFEGKVASFPFDDHNCPPIQLIISFCHSAYSWLKEDIENVVVVHCKAGMARTGLMISSLLLYLKFFPTAEESIDYYNQKRCVDGKGLVLPSQIRYVKYFERVLTYFNGENQPGRRCMLRGFRLHRCPYWIRPHITVSDHNGVLFSSKKHHRTKELSPEDFWFSAPKKGVMVFALPGEPGLTKLAGDFKIHFHDGQGDFYCWLNTIMMENRKILNTGDLDGFDKRKLPSPGFQVEVVLADYTGAVPALVNSETVAKKPDETSGSAPAPTGQVVPAPNENKESGITDKDDVFSDNESQQKAPAASAGGTVSTTPSSGISTKSFLGQLDMEHTIIEAQSYDICFEYIEEMIHKQEPLNKVLRLLILFCVTNSGLPKKHFDYLRRELLHSYGFEHMATLNNLEKAGLFRKQETKSNWLRVKHALQLVVEDTDTANPNDISYVFSGYAPLSIRLVQNAVRSGWRPMEEILKLLPGPHYETKRGGFSSSPSFDMMTQGSSSSINKIADGRRSLVLVVFIGGVTFAEISALRFLSAQEGMAYDLIVGTTKIISGNSLAETFSENLG